MAKRKIENSKKGIIVVHEQKGRDYRVSNDTDVNRKTPNMCCMRAWNKDWTTF